MKILQIIPSLASGGAERFVVDLCNELSAQGEDVYLCIILNPNVADYGFYLPELNKSVHFISLNQNKGFRLKKLWLLYKVLQDVKPNIIHSHLSVLLYVYALALINFRDRFIYTIHNPADKTGTSILFKTLNFIYFSLGFIKVITISEECKFSYEKYYGLRNATLINNGRKKSTPSLTCQEVKDEINQLKKAESDLVFVHVARFHKQKNQELLIRVFNRLANEGLGYILLVLGDWSFCEEAKALAQTANERIHFLGTKKNVSDYLFLADAFCLTSIFEGMPISLLEALSCGCIPVCTAVGGIKDIIEDGVTGFLAKEVSEDAYYEAVERFLKQRESINKEALIQLFNDNYSIELCANKHLELFRSINNSL